MKNRKNEAYLASCYIFIMLLTIIAIAIITRTGLKNQPQPPEPTATPVTTPSTTPQPPREPRSPQVPTRYSEIPLSDADIRLLAQMTYHEARGEPHEGKIAINKVVFNRILSDRFPDTVYEIIYAPRQFECAPLLEDTEPTLAEYIAVYDAIVDRGPLLDLDVVYFAQQPENDNIAAIIGNHVFCYNY